MKRKLFSAKRKLLSAISITAGFIGVTFIYANWPIRSLPAGTKADSVLVLKREGTMILLKENQKIKEYSIALGGNPTGKKIMEGDERTPEGHYRLDYRNPKS